MYFSLKDYSILQVPAEDLLSWLWLIAEETFLPPALPGGAGICSHSPEQPLLHMSLP